MPRSPHSDSPATAVFRNLTLPGESGAGEARARRTRAAEPAEDSSDDSGGEPPAVKRSVLGGLAAKCLWWSGAGAICAGLAAGGFVTGAIAGWLRASEPIPAMDLYDPPEMTVLFDGDGAEFSRLFEEQRRVVALRDLPSRLPEAFVAIEDTNFYHHPGIDVRGLARAVHTNLTRGRMDQGASTITQQLVRNIVEEVGRERTMTRKAREALNALRMERHYTKEQILEVYLNHIYLGSGTYGVEAASQAYFGKSALDVDLPEIALLAGLPQIPERYSPLNDPDRARERRRQVLDRMLDLRWIDEASHEDALDAPVLRDSALAFRSTALEDRYFADAVRRELTRDRRIDLQQLRSQGFEIETTLHRGLQRIATEALRAGIDAEERNWVEDRPRRFARELSSGAFDRPPSPGQRRMARVVRIFPGRLVVEIGDGWRADLEIPEGGAHLFTEDLVERGDGVDVLVRKLDPAGRRLFRGQLLPDKGLQGAIVCLDRETAEIRAIAGGRDWGDRANDGFFNRATSARRQAGSTLKPLFLVAALEDGYRPSTIVQDRPMTFANGYRPRNFENRFHGSVPLQEVVEQSHNAGTIWTVREVGLRRSIETVRRFDRIDGEEAWDLPLEMPVVLGSSSVTPLELAAAFVPFANGGVAAPPTTLRAVRGPGGRPVRFENPGRQRLLARGESAAMSQMLAGVMTHGTGRRVREQLPPALRNVVAGKTGTTNNTRDAWFVGYTPDHVVAVWIGFDRPISLGDGRTGGVVAGPVWANFVAQAWEELGRDEPPRFPVPEGYTVQLFNRTTGQPVDPAHASPGGAYGWQIVEERHSIDWAARRAELRTIADAQSHRGTANLTTDE